MPDILRKIESYKRREISEAKVRMPFKTLERQAREHDPTRGFLRVMLRVVYELLKGQLITIAA